MPGDFHNVPRLPSAGLSLLSERDFADGEDHYIETAYRILADPDSQPPIPELVTSAAIGMLYFDLYRAGLGKTYERYVAPLAQIADSAYMLVAAETWELNTKQVDGLIEDALTLWSRELERIEGRPLNFDSWDERTAEAVRGLNSKVEVFRPLREYVTSQSAYKRIQTLLDTVADVIALQAGVKRRHKADFEPAAGCAWGLGRGLGILDLVGAVPRDPEEDR